MCLAIPGKIIELTHADDPIKRSGVIDLQGSQIEVNLALVPTATKGSWVLVHAGYAIEELEEDAAKETWHWLKEADLVEGEMDTSD